MRPDPVEIVGVDPGLNFAGAACIDPTTKKLVRHIVVNGTLSPKGPVPPLATRVFKIYHEMFRFLHQRKGMKIIAVEGPAYVRRSASMEQLARCRQAVHDMAAFFLDDFIWMEISPTEAKYAATGSGKAKKPEVSEGAQRICGGDLGDYTKHAYTLGDATSVALGALVRYEDDRRTGRYVGR